MPKLTTLDALRLALEHHKAGNFPAAEHLYRKILVKDADNADALHLLGVLLRQTGRVRTGIDLLHRAVERSGNVAQFHNHLGQALRDLGRAEEAVESYRTALSLDPNYAEAHNNLGQALHDLHHTPQAIAAFRKAISLAADYPDPHANLGQALLDLGRVDEAAGECRAAVRINPNFAEAHNCLASCLAEQGLIDDAIGEYRQAAAANPYFQVAWSNLLLFIQISASFDAKTILDEHREWSRLFADPLFNGIPPTSDTNPDRRLRIGYVSPDFRDQPVGRFLTPLLENHDRTQFEIHCFADVLVPDTHTRRLQSHADHWHNIATHNDDEVADMIRHERIDILVDLRAHVSANRLLVFARKPAPLQIRYLNYPGTTGLSMMDFRFTDPHLDPPQQPASAPAQSYYTERSIPLSGSYWCYQPPADAPAIAPLPADRNGFVTFGCLNPFSRISPQAFALWRELLNQVPNSRLLLNALQGAHRDRLKNELAQHQINPQRLDFVGKQSHADALATYAKIDIGLDPFPFPGAITTCDALYMGVPTVTLAPPSGSAVGRIGASILSSAGFPVFIAHTPEDYLRIATTCAREQPKLSALRLQLRERMLKSPLMDAKSYTRSVEVAYRLAWRTWSTERQ